MANLSPAPKLQFFDANGNPLVGGKLYSYAAGTTTPLATFTDSTEGSSNPNPTFLDSRGEANVWLGSAQYKLKLTTSTDVEIWTVDNIGGGVTLNQLAAPGGAALIGNTPSGTISATTVQGAINEIVSDLAASSGSSLVGFLQAGTSAVTRTAQSKMRDVVSVKDFGVVGNGVTDDTAAIQAALNAAAGVATLLIPKPAVKYVHGALTIPSQTSLVIEPGTLFEAIPGLADGVKLWNMVNKTDISVWAYGATLKGIKSEYTSGEQRHGFFMQGSSRISCFGLAVNDTGGDGFYIGSSGSQPYCESIRLVDISADNNRRQGLSLISGKDVKIVRARLTNTNGTAPSAGIDIEPNSSTEFLEGIVFDSPYTYNNRNGGIAIYLLNLGDGKVVDITVNNHRDDGSDWGIAVGSNQIANTARGQIVFNDPVWNGNVKGGALMLKYSENLPTLYLNRPYVINCNTGANAPSLLGSGIIFDGSGLSAGSTMGNTVINDPTIKDTRGTKLMIYAVFAQGYPTQDITIKGRLDIDSGQSGLIQINQSSSDINVIDETRMLQRQVTGTTSINANILGSILHNAGASTGIALNSAGTYPIGATITLELRAAQNLTFTPTGTESVPPLSSVAGKWINSNVIGSKITLLRRDSTTWDVLNQVGTWTVQP